MPLKIRNAANHLIEIASELFAKNGYESVSVRQIAKAADLNIASISYYFGSKDELYYACAEHLSDYLAKKIKGFNQADYLTPRAQFDAYLKQRIATYLDPKASLLFSFYIRERLSPTKAYKHIENVTESMNKQSLELFQLTFPNTHIDILKAKNVGILGTLILLITIKERIFDTFGIKDESDAINIIYKKIEQLFLSDL